MITSALRQSHHDCDLFQLPLVQVPEKWFPKNLSTVQNSTDTCNTSWVQSSVGCLNDHFIVGMSWDPGLSWHFVINCYFPNELSKYYSYGGCLGDTTYNALHFLHSTGTISNRFWKENSTEIYGVCNKNQFIDGRVEDIPLYCISGEDDGVGSIHNISPIKEKELLKTPTGEIISIERSRLINKSQIFLRGSVVTTFLITQDWNDPGDEIYISKSEKIVGSQSAVIIGWGQENMIPYWVCRNSKGTNWGVGGFWKHAMYPLNTISCVDVSVIHENQIYGSLITFEINSNMEKNLNLDVLDTKLKNLGYIRIEPEHYHWWMWLVCTIFILIIILKFIY